VCVFDTFDIYTIEETSPRRKIIKKRYDINLCRNVMHIGSFFLDQDIQIQMWVDKQTMTMKTIKATRFMSYY
jgi:hypothetical protein